MARYRMEIFKAFHGSRPDPRIASEGTSKTRGFSRVGLGGVGKSHGSSRVGSGQGVLKYHGSGRVILIHDPTRKKRKKRDPIREKPYFFLQFYSPVDGKKMRYYPLSTASTFSG